MKKVRTTTMLQLNPISLATKSMAMVSPGLVAAVMDVRCMGEEDTPPPLS